MKCIFVLVNPSQPGLVCVCASVLFLLCLVESQTIRQKQKRDLKKTKKTKTKAQVTGTFHQQPSISTLRLLACHSISHSVDYTPRGARAENHAGNPILCHIKCRERSFRCCVITTETAGGDAEGGGGDGDGESLGDISTSLLASFVAYVKVHLHCISRSTGNCVSGLLQFGSIIKLYLQLMRLAN